MVIHKRAAAFETVGHAGDVDFCQNIAGQIRFNVNAGGSLDEVRFATTTVSIEDERGRIVFVQPVIEIGGKKSGPSGIVKNADPVRIASFGRLSRAARKRLICRSLDFCSTDAGSFFQFGFVRIARRNFGNRSIFAARSTAR